MERAGTRRDRFEGIRMTDQLLTMIDSALEQFRSRDLVAANEVVDFLLDLRLAAIDPTNDALQQLLESESTPTGS